MAAPDRPTTAARPPGAAPSTGGRVGSGDKSLPELGRELIDLTVAYTKQETLDPLRSLGGKVRNGVLGSALASVGLIFLLVGVLRLVQVEARPHLSGAMSWVPYLAAVVVAGLVAGFALKQIGERRGR